jgi:DNA-binding HxlR family transcriptional regulator
MVIIARWPTPWGLLENDGPCLLSETSYTNPTDLLTRLGNITPKWLSLRLRHLEDAGVVERVKGQDKREKWYRLTPAGRDLQPVIEALRSWGLRHAMRPPLPGEVVHPDLAIITLTGSLNNRNKKLPGPRNWLFKFTHGVSYTLSFDGESWITTQGERNNPDVILAITPEAWTTFLTVKKNERKNLAQALHISGNLENITEFLHIFGVKDRNGQSPYTQTP